MAKITLPAAPTPLKIVKVRPPIGKSLAGQLRPPAPETGYGTLPLILFPAAARQAPPRPLDDTRKAPPSISKFWPVI
jgi:hypothetical protein